jgi:hypothetical protein
MGRHRIQVAATPATKRENSKVPPMQKRSRGSEESSSWMKVYSARAKFPTNTVVFDLLGPSWLGRKLTQGPCNGCQRPIWNLAAVSGAAI